MRKKSWVLMALLVLLLLLFRGSCLRRYHEMSAMRERIDDNLARVDNALQVRNDLLPHIVDTAKGHASKEKMAFEDVVRARVGMSEAKNVEELSDASTTLGGALADLLALVDACPPLKDDGEFGRLCDELAGAEDRIAVECRNYNESVREYNASLEPFPNNFIAGVFGLARDETSFDAPGGAKPVFALDRGAEG